MWVHRFFFPERFGAYAVSEFHYRAGDNQWIFRSVGNRAGKIWLKGFAAKNPTLSALGNYGVKKAGGRLLNKKRWIWIPRGRRCHWVWQISCLMDNVVCTVVVTWNRSRTCVYEWLMKGKQTSTSVSLAVLTFYIWRDIGGICEKEKQKNGVWERVRGGEKVWNLFDFLARACQILKFAEALEFDWAKQCYGVDMAKGRPGKMKTKKKWAEEKRGGEGLVRSPNELPARVWDLYSVKRNAGFGSKY